MPSQRLGQSVALVFDRQQVAVGQGDDHEIEFVLPRLSLVDGTDTEFLSGFGHAGDLLLQPNRGGNSGSEFLREPFVAALNAVQVHVGGVVHQVILQTIRHTGSSGFGSQIAVDQVLDVAPRVRLGNVRDECIESVALGRRSGPLRVVGVVELLGGHAVLGQPVELLDSLVCLRAELIPDVIHVGEDLVIHDHRRTSHLPDRESQLRDQFLQRVFIKHRVVIELRSPGFVVYGNGTELRRQNLATQSRAGLVQGDLYRTMSHLLQRIGRHQTTRPSADNGHIPRRHQ